VVGMDHTSTALLAAFFVSFCTSTVWSCLDLLPGLGHTRAIQTYGSLNESLGSRLWTFGRNIGKLPACPVRVQGRDERGAQVHLAAECRHCHSRDAQAKTGGSMNSWEEAMERRCCSCRGPGPLGAGANSSSSILLQPGPAGL